MVQHCEPIGTWTSRLRAWLVCLLCFAVVTCHAGHALDRLYTPEELTSQSLELFEVQYRKADERWVKVTLQAADAARREVQRSFFDTFAVRVTLVLAPNSSVYQALSGPAMEHTQACAVASSRLIILNLDELRKSTSNQFWRVMVHEMVHLYLGVRCETEIPRWLNEGIAQAVADPFEPQDLAAVDWAVWLGSTIPLGDLRTSFPADPARMRLAYVQSRAIVDFIVREDYGNSLAKFVQTISGGSGRDLLGSFANGVYERLLLQRFVDSRRQNLQWTTLLLNDSVIWGVAALALVFAATGVVWRRRRLRRAAAAAVPADTLLDAGFVDDGDYFEDDFAAPIPRPPHRPVN